MFLAFGLSVYVCHHSISKTNNSWKSKLGILNWTYHELSYKGDTQVFSKISNFKKKRDWKKGLAINLVIKKKKKSRKSKFNYLSLYQTEMFPEKFLIILVNIKGGCSWNRAPLHPLMYCCNFLHLQTLTLVFPGSQISLIMQGIFCYWAILQILICLQIYKMNLL